MKTLGDRIRNQRELLHLQQSDVAKKIGVTKQTLYKYEKNIVTNVPSDKIQALAEVLKVTPAYLMGWEDYYTYPTEKDYCVLQDLQVRYGEDVRSATENYISLDTEDRAEIRGEMKHMLKAGKYNSKKTNM